MNTGPREVAKWRIAHPNLSIGDDALATVAPFPSLYAGDFAVFLEARGAEPQVVSFVTDIRRELAWVYDNWKKAQRDGQPAKIIEAMLNDLNVEAGGSVSPKTFIRDWARAHGIELNEAKAPADPAWFGAMGQQPAAAQMTVAEPPPQLTGADHVDR